MEQWQINRAGVINFWYYDDEEFYFENGRLLLRGANGSGKSVTMQSLVPLLFDGNKSPERLDPFGSRARKMESYLLSDGLDLEERTGYLFLEFAKPEAGRYLTIGMGMKARRNMQMQTWYFIVLDNRRVGHHQDLSLYKDIGDKLPLTQKELENKIGNGGFMTLKQREYKEKVNEHLFGYSDLTDFEELIELLIQIRSPKLSKEFKPTTMYEIMQNSLITLTEDDLRPMSEAIENMDEIKVKIDALAQAKKAIGRIETAYSKYNRFLLAQKAKRYLDYHEEVASGVGRAEKIAQDLKAYTQRCGELKAQIEALKDEESELRSKESRLREHDLSRLADEKINLEAKAVTLTQQATAKTEQLEKMTDVERGLLEDQKGKLSERDRSEKDINETLSEMEALIERPLFDEHSFFADEYLKSGHQPYRFEYHKTETERYLGKLKTGLNALRQLEEVRGFYEELLNEKDLKSKSVEAQKRRVMEHERQLGGIKEEFAEKVFGWAETHSILEIGKPILSQVVERAYQYGTPYRFDEILEPARTAYERIREEHNSEKSRFHGEKAVLQKSFDEKLTALNALKAQKEPEPERTSAVLINRQRLKGANIPFVPLYKALDFNKDLNDSLKGILEEGLQDMGILDALIIDPKYQKAVLDMDAGMADKYLFADPQVLSHNLSTYLKPETADVHVETLIVEDIIRSLILNPSESGSYITETGHYGMGIVTGKVSGTSESRFIGYQSRKRYKEQLIDLAMAEMDSVQNQIDAIQKQIDEYESKLLACQGAWALFPGKSDLDEAFYDLQKEQRELNALSVELERIGIRADQHYGKLKTQQLEVHEKTQGIHLPHRSTEYQEAIEDMEAYKSMLHALILEDTKRLHLIDMLSSLEERLESHAETIDNLRYDLNRIHRETGVIKDRIMHVTRELELSDYQAVLNDIEQCRVRLEKIPEQMQSYMNELAQKESGIQTKHSDLENNQKQLEKSKQMSAVYQWAFTEEWKLGYSELEKIDGSVLEQAQNVLTAYGVALEEGKTIVDLHQSLNEKYLKEMGELAEYNLKGIQHFKEMPFETLSEDDRIHIERFDIIARMQGREVRFYEMLELIDRQIAENGSLLDEQDRELFEEILIKSVSRKISSKIYHSEKWVKKIDELMSSMNTSSGLNFNLRWLTRQAQSEDQMSTRELVDILKGDQSLLNREQKDRLITHFRSKIQETRNRMGDGSDQRSFLAIMKEILDYRKWFEFQLYYTKRGEKKRELTNNAFFTFSGGEKAMAMYVPLFSAVYAKYQGGNADCPKVISLDEAFAGVDEKNIEDMFRLLVELKLSFIANSQVLFGDYETVPALGIYELIRPENVTYVTLIRYLWNGKVRRMVVEDGNDQTVHSDN